MKHLFIFYCLLSGVFLSAQSLTDSLILHIPTRNNIADNAKYNFGNSNSNVTYTTDQYGNANQAIAFNGTSTTIRFNTSTGAIFKRNLPYTFSVNLNISSATGTFPVFYSDDYYLKYSGFWIQIIDGFVWANLGDGQANGTGNRFSAKASTLLSANTWYNIIVVFKSINTIDIYINGIKETITTSGGNNTTMGWANSVSSYGVANTGAGVSKYFNGKMDNLCIWNRTLSAAEISVASKLIYYSDLDYNTKDFSGNSVTSTSNNISAAENRFGNNNGSIGFNGLNSTINLEAIAEYKPSFPFTISAWVYQKNTTGIQPIFISSDHTSGIYNGILIYIDNGKPVLYFGDGNCAGAQCRKTYTANSSLNSSAWNLVTVSASNINTIKIYINGVLSGTTSSGTGTTVSQAASGAGKIGFLTDANGLANKYFNGMIDQLFVTNTQLADADVLTFYTNSEYVFTNPQNISINVGDSIKLFSDGRGTSTPAYQWEKYISGSWQNVNAANQKNYLKSAAQISDSGMYRAKIVINGKNLYTSAAKITVNSTTNATKLYSNLFSIYPNPSNGKCIIKGISKNCKMNLFSLDGKKIKTINYIPNVELQLNLLPGCYILQSENLVSQKLIIQ